MPIDLLAQSAALFCPNALRLYRQSILSISFTVTMIWWRGAVRFVQELNFRADNRKCHLTYWLKWRLYSAPTVFINSMAHSGYCIL